MEAWYIRPKWRLFIDGIVLITFLGMLTLYGLEHLPAEFDDTLSDDIVDLEEKILSLVPEATPVTWTEFEGGFPVKLELSENSTPAQTPSQVYSELKKSVVYITSYDDFDQLISLGTGFAITSDGLIATNYHVIEDAHKIIIADNDGVLHDDIHIETFDPVKDIAFLRVETLGVPSVPLVTDSSVEVGDLIYTLGNAEQLLNTFSSGIVSAIRSYDIAGIGAQIQITAPVSSGSSGSPLVDAEGALVGMVAWVVEYEDNAVAVQNINFAIPLEEMVSFE